MLQWEDCHYIISQNKGVYYYVLFQLFFPKQ